MDEQKRLFIAIILSIVVIAGWNFFFVPPETINQQQPQNEQTKADAKGAVGNDIVTPETSTTGAIVEDFKPADGLPAPQVTESFRDIKVNTPIYDITISEKQASVTSLILKKFKEGVQADSPFKQMVAPELTAGLFSLDLEGKSIPGLDKAIFKASTETSLVLKELTVSEGEKKITFSWTSPHGIVVDKIYTFSASTYLIGLDIVVKNGSSMPLKDALEISMPFALTKEGEAYSQFGAYGPEAYINGNLETVKPNDIQDNQKDKDSNKQDKNTLRGIVEWAGNGDRYFISCIMPVKAVESVVKLSGTDAFVVTRYIQSMDRLDSGKQAQFSFECYMGPKSLKVLGGYKNNLKKAIDFGWFDVLAKPCLIGMNFIHDIIPNYGVAIILLNGRPK